MNSDTITDDAEPYEVVLRFRSGAELRTTDELTCSILWQTATNAPLDARGRVPQRSAV